MRVSKERSKGILTPMGTVVVHGGPSRRKVHSGMHGGKGFKIQEAAGGVRLHNRYAYEYK